METRELMPKVDQSQGLIEAKRRIFKCQRTKTLVLDLGELALDHLPENVRKLTWLKRLYVHRNKLTFISDWIGELSELDEISFCDNPLESLPSSLGQLSKLKGFYISNAAVTVDNEVVGKLANLHYLTFSDLSLG